MTSIFNNKQRQKRTIDYHKKKLENPFYSKKKKINHFSNLKIMLLFLISFVLFISLFWFIFISSFWTIKEINLNDSDLASTSNNEILELAKTQARERNWLFIPQNNLLFFNQKKFLSTAKNQYRFQNIETKKQWPNKLVINIKEKILACIWDEDDKYYLIDTEGYVISEIKQEETVNKTHPLIINESSLKISNKKIQNNIDYISFTAELFRKLIQKISLEINIDYFIIDNDVNTIKVLTSEGVKISFNTEDDPDKQIEKLFIIKKERLKEDFKNKKYIDLRFGDKVYFQ